MSKERQIQQAYRLAKERYAEMGVNTDRALGKLAGISISLQIGRAHV